MKRLRALFVSSRPLSWVNTAYPFAAAYLLTTREIDLAFVLGTLYFLIPYNLAMYGINDVFDYESDLRNPRKGGVEGAVLDRGEHRATLIAAVVTNVPFLIALVLLGSPVSWLVLAISVFAVIAYSAPGLRFKERPFVDSLTSATHFVSPAVYGIALAGTVVTPGLVALLVAFFLWGSPATRSARCRTSWPTGPAASARSPPSSARGPPPASRSAPMSRAGCSCSCCRGRARSPRSSRSPTRSASGRTDR